MIAVERHKIEQMVERDQSLAYDTSDGFLIKVASCDDKGLQFSDGTEELWADADVLKIMHLREAYHPCRRYDVEETVVEEKDYDNYTKRSHSSYGLMRFGKISGQAKLFDSEIRHQHYISMTISTADVNERDSHRTFSPKDQLIEVCMSELQFSRCITSMNYSAGTPVTLHRIDGTLLPEPPVKKSELDRHRDRLNKVKKNIMSTVSEPLAQLRVWKEAKKRPTLKELGELIFQMENKSSNAGSNAEFAHTVLTEAMEDQVSACKTEVDGYVRHAIVSAGLEHIDGLKNLSNTQSMPLTLESSKRILKDKLANAEVVISSESELMTILDIAGCSEAFAQEVRKAVLKKQFLRLESAYKDDFIKNGQDAIGVSEEAMLNLWDQIEIFGRK